MGYMRWCRWRKSVIQIIDFEALAAFVDRTGMCALTGFQARRLARFGWSVCGATDLKFRWSHACTLPTPPHPPHDENRPHGGQTEQGKGRVTVKIFKGGSGILEKPVDGTAYYHVSRCFSKKKWSPGCLKNPRVVPISTRVGSFLPRAVFCVFVVLRSASISISLIYLKKERKRGRTEAIGSIHGFYFADLKLTTGFVSIFFKPVDEIGIPWNVNPYKSTACAFSPGFPRSTGRNAYTPLEKVRNER